MAFQPVLSAKECFGKGWAPGKDLEECKKADIQGGSGRGVPGVLEDVVPGRSSETQVLAVLATYHPGLLFFISLDLCPICDPCPSCPTHGLSWHRVVMKATVADSVCTPLAGCGAHAGTWYGSVRYPFWPTPDIARFANLVTARRCAKVLAGGSRLFLAGML